jgi:hypothetical protein
MKGKQTTRKKYKNAPFVDDQVKYQNMTPY